MPYWWTQDHATISQEAAHDLQMQQGRTGIKSTKREQVLHVSGVGTNSQECHYNSVLPLTLRDVHGSPVECTYTTPTINNSTLPALLGLNSLISNGALMDLRNMQLHFTGPGPLQYTQHLPEGTQTFELHQAPSGHLMLPCCKYATTDEMRKLRLQKEDTLTLHSTTGATHSQTSTDLVHDININPWNAFQHKYKGQGLSRDHLSTFYRWPERLELEKTHKEEEVAQQFLADLKECENDVLPELI